MTTPKYQKIRIDLENQIIQGNFPVGSQVPTEQQLCDLHGVSRITARRALESLRASGLIERISGHGSFVRKLPKGHMEIASEIAIISGFTSTSLVAPSVDNWGFQIIRSLDDCLPSHGFHATLLPLQDGAEDMFWQRIDALGPRLAGVLGFAVPHLPPVLDELDHRGIPWVTINAVSREQTYNFVSANNFASNHSMALEIAQIGYQKALFLGVGLQTVANGDRFLGFLSGWLEAGQRQEDLDYLQVASTAELKREESDRLLNLLCGKDRPRVIFCGGDLLAVAALKLCLQQGLSIPGDVAIIGGTGLMLAEHVTPSLTVLAQPMAKIGQAAEAMLVEMIRTKKQRVPGRYIPCPLVRRDSCPIGEVC